MWFISSGVFASKRLVDSCSTERWWLSWWWLSIRGFSKSSQSIPIKISDQVSQVNSGTHRNLHNRYHCYHPQKPDHRLETPLEPRSPLSHSDTYQGESDEYECEMTVRGDSKSHSRLQRHDWFEKGRGSGGARDVMDCRRSIHGRLLADGKSLSISSQSLELRLPRDARYVYCVLI